MDIATVDLSGKSSLADYMIVASGTSQKHLSTLADHIAEKLHGLGMSFVPIEGKDVSDWVVVDAGTVIVHLFRPEVRQLYNLEKMWGMPELTMEAAL